MDAITLLKQDHKAVEKLFKQFEKASQPAEQRKLAQQVIRELSVHAAIEEMVFYPAVRDRVPETEGTVLESLEEHHIVKWVLSELEDMKPDHERFKAKMTVLIESVRHHVEEEESELFPEVRKEIKRKELAELGEALEKAKRSRPPVPIPGHRTPLPAMWWLAPRPRWSTRSRRRSAARSSRPFRRATRARSRRGPGP